MPAEPGGTEGGGTAAEAVTSQYSVVAGTASLGLPGQVGTDNGAVPASLAGAMIRDGMLM